VPHTVSHAHGDSPPFRLGRGGHGIGLPAGGGPPSWTADHRMALAATILAQH